jgi:hypothetical protein
VVVVSNVEYRSVGLSGSGIGGRASSVENAWAESIDARLYTLVHPCLHFLCVGLNPRRLCEIGDMRSPGERSQSIMSAFYVFSKPDGYRVSELNEGCLQGVNCWAYWGCL